MIRLCLLDCDGTLVDSQSAIVSSMAKAFSAHGCPEPDAEAVRRVVGLPLRAAIAQLLPESEAAASGPIAESYSAAFAGLRRDGAVNEPLYPGAREALAALDADGWLLGIATGKSHRGLVATLAGHGLESRFVTLQTSDRAAGKPNPDMVLCALAETGADAASTVVVGDTTFDMMMARNAGALAVGVTWGYHRADELRASGAHAIVSSFEDVAPTLARLLDGEAE